MMADERRGPENRAENRWETIKAIWAKDEHRWLYVLVGITAGFLLGFTIESFAQSMATPNWRETLASLFPEAFGITVTVLVLNGLAERRVRLEMKRDLIFRMGSRQRDVAVHAAEHLGEHGWLQDGTLRGGYFAKANLYKAGLSGANLQETSLLEATLEGANLAFANLIGANLAFAKLQGAVLMDAKLQGADLSWSNLEGANLGLARLQGANLEDAKLQGVEYLLSATFDEWTVLPDGKNYDPELGPKQLIRFIDPTRPDFWQPDWVKDAGG